MVWILCRSVYKIGEEMGSVVQRIRLLKSACRDPKEVIIRVQLDRSSIMIARLVEEKHQLAVSFPSQTWQSNANSGKLRIKTVTVSWTFANNKSITTVYTERLSKRMRPFF